MQAFGEDSSVGSRKRSTRALELHSINMLLPATNSSCGTIIKETRYTSSAFLAGPSLPASLLV